MSGDSADHDADLCERVERIRLGRPLDRWPNERLDRVEGARIFNAWVAVMWQFVVAAGGRGSGVHGGFDGGLMPMDKQMTAGTCDCDVNGSF